MHTPNFEHLEEQVFARFLQVHRRFEATRSLIRPQRLHQLRYEDLTKDPVREVRRLYEQLDLGDFDTLRPRLEKYLAENARYESNKWQPTDAQVREITDRWREFAEQYGYVREV